MPVSGRKTLIWCLLHYNCDSIWAQVVSFKYWRKPCRTFCPKKGLLNIEVSNRVCQWDSNQMTPTDLASLLSLSSWHLISFPRSKLALILEFCCFPCDTTQIFDRFCLRKSNYFPSTLKFVALKRSPADSPKNGRQRKCWSVQCIDVRLMWICWTP